MTDTLMATDRTEPGSSPKLQPLIPVGIFGFLVSALIWYRVQVSPGATIDGNWLVDVIAGLHGAVGFAPAFLVSVLGLAWSSIWFFRNRIEQPGARLAKIVVFGVCLSILDGFGAEAAAAGEIGHWIAVRIDDVFGRMLGTSLAAIAVFAAFLLATDFCFYRFFEPLRERVESVTERSAPSEQAPGAQAGSTSVLPEAEVEDAAVQALMAGGVALEDPPEAPSAVDAAGDAELEDGDAESAVAAEADLANEEVTAAVEAARAVLESEDVSEATEADAAVEEDRAPTTFDDPLQVDEEEELLGDEAECSAERPFSDDVPTIVDLGQSSIELPVAGDQDESVLAEDPAEVTGEEADDLALDTVLHESGHLPVGQDVADALELVETAEDDLEPTAEAPSIAPGLFGEQALDPAEIEALSGDDEADEVWIDDGETAESVAHREAPTPLEGLLFPEPLPAAEELHEDEVDDLIAEVSSLAHEVEELTRESTRHEIDAPVAETMVEEATPEARLSESDDGAVSAEEAAHSQGALFPVVSDDELLSEAAELVRSTGRASVGLLARRLRIDWDQADQVLVRLAAEGIVEIDEQSGQARVLG